MLSYRVTPSTSPWNWPSTWRTCSGRAVASSAAALTRARVGRSLKSGKSQGAYRTLPVQNRHNAHEQVLLPCSNLPL